MRIVLLACLALSACGAEAGTPRSELPQAAAAVRAERARPDAPLPDTGFAALVARLSEGGGWFDTDNLISNEAGFLKVLGSLDRLGVRGGAYVGVGPDQNFSYIARIRPEVAFLVDIRRDNLLHHLLLRALMEASPTRVEFLSALHGVVPPPDPAAWTGRSAEELTGWVDAAPRDETFRTALAARIEGAVPAFGVPLSDEDLGTIGRFHRTFMEEGLDLRFTSFGRAPRPHYPTYRRLVLETDLEGRPASYLAREEDYAYVRSLQMRGRVVPVVGDLAGDRALRAIGAWLRENGLALSAIYASNVEFYLWQGGSFDAWVANVAALPAASNAVVIRSFFPNAGGSHPSAVPGYFAVQTLQSVSTLVAGGFGSYFDVVTRGALPLD